MRVISPVSLPTYLSVVYRNNMSAVPASIHLKTNVDRIYLLLLKTVLSFPSLLSKTMSIFQDFFKTFLQFSQIQDYFQDLNEFINFKTFSSLEENVQTMQDLPAQGNACEMPEAFACDGSKRSRTLIHRRRMVGQPHGMVDMQYCLKGKPSSLPHTTSQPTK